MQTILRQTISDLSEVLPKLMQLEPALARLARTMLETWNRRGKVLIAGNGGSAADAMHFAEELCVRFQKDRRALAAIALTDPTIVTCAANDLGYDRVFSRQIEAYGNEGDVFIALTTSGNSVNLIRAIETAKQNKMVTAAFLGRSGGKARGMCDIELIVPSDITARVQEAHKVLYHALCEWVEAQL